MFRHCNGHRTEALSLSNLPDEIKTIIFRHMLVGDAVDFSPPSFFESHREAKFDGLSTYLVELDRKVPIPVGYKNAFHLACTNSRFYSVFNDMIRPFRTYFLSPTQTVRCTSCKDPDDSPMNRIGNVQDSFYPHGILQNHTKLSLNFLHSYVRSFRPNARQFCPHLANEWYAKVSQLCPHLSHINICIVNHPATQFSLETLLGLFPALSTMELTLTCPCDIEWDSFIQLRFLRELTINCFRRYSIVEKWLLHSSMRLRAIRYYCMDSSDSGEAVCLKRVCVNVFLAPNLYVSSNRFSDEIMQKATYVLRTLGAALSKNRNIVAFEVQNIRPCMSEKLDSKQSVKFDPPPNPFISAGKVRNPLDWIQTATNGTLLCNVEMFGENSFHPMYSVLREVHPSPASEFFIQLHWMGSIFNYSGGHKLSCVKTTIKYLVSQDHQNCETWDSETVDYSELTHFEMNIPDEREAVSLYDDLSLIPGLDQLLFQSSSSIKVFVANSTDFYRVQDCYVQFLLERNMREDEEGIPVQDIARWRRNVRLDIVQFSIEIIKRASKIEILDLSTVFLESLNEQNRLESFFRFADNTHELQVYVAKSTIKPILPIDDDCEDGTCTCTPEYFAESFLQVLPAILQIIRIFYRKIEKFSITANDIIEHNIPNESPRERHQFEHRRKYLTNLSKSWYELNRLNISNPAVSTVTVSDFLGSVTAVLK